jgi:hypothetical protein
MVPHKTPVVQITCWKFPAPPITLLSGLSPKASKKSRYFEWLRITFWPAACSSAFDFVCSAYRKEVPSFRTSADKAMAFHRNSFREMACRRRVRRSLSEVGTPKPSKLFCDFCAPSTSLRAGFSWLNRGRVNPSLSVSDLSSTSVFSVSFPVKLSVVYSCEFVVNFLCFLRVLRGLIIAIYKRRATNDELP